MVLFNKNIRADLKVYTSRMSNMYVVCVTQTFQPHPTVQSLHSGSYLRFAFELCMEMGNSHQHAVSIPAAPEITFSWYLRQIPWNNADMACGNSGKFAAGDECPHRVAW